MTGYYRRTSFAMGAAILASAFLVEASVRHPTVVTAAVKTFA